MIRSLDLNTNQMLHLHRGIERAENQRGALDMQEQEMDAEGVKLRAILTKVGALNRSMEKVLENEGKRSVHSPRVLSDVLSSSQNIKSQRSSPFTLMGPPPVPRRSPMVAVRPNVTRLWVGGSWIWIPRITNFFPCFTGRASTDAFTTEEIRGGVELWLIEWGWN